MKDIIIETTLTFFEEDVIIAGKIYNIKAIDRRAFDEGVERIRNDIARKLWIEGMIRRGYLEVKTEIQSL